MIRRVDNILGGGTWHRYSVTGPRGAVNLTFGEPIPGSTVLDKWFGVDFGYHSPRPFYEGQTHEDHCELLGEVRCFYDGSGMRAELYAHLAAAGDEEAIYAVLEAEYEVLFGAAHTHEVNR